jgi:tetratricopeptide (TPR) repeat protein
VTAAAALLLPFCPSTSLGGEKTDLRHAWELTAQMRLREANAAFRPLTEGNRPAQLGAAVVKIELPPFSEEKLAEARQSLTSLAKANPNDETGIRARYLLGRIRQLHDAAGAGESPEFIALVRDHSGHYLAQLARLKLILHRLYATEANPTVAERLADAEQSGALTTAPALQRDFHQMMGDAYLYFGDQRSQALRHFQQAEALGILDASARATVLVQIGELARLEGQPAVAAAAYKKFLEEFRRDIRGYEVRRRLATLEGAP